MPSPPPVAVPNGTLECRPRLFRVLVRQAEKAALIPGHAPRFVDSEADGEWLYNAVLGLKLEGVVAKRARSCYVAGISPDWLKIKRPGAVVPGRFHRAI